MDETRRYLRGAFLSWEKWRIPYNVILCGPIYGLTKIWLDSAVLPGSHETKHAVGHAVYLSVIGNTGYCLFPVIKCSVYLVRLAGLEGTAFFRHDLGEFLIALLVIINAFYCLGPLVECFGYVVARRQVGRARSILYAVMLLGFVGLFVMPK